MTTQAQVQGLGEFSRRGFTLEHRCDDRLDLMHQGELVASFIQTGATEESLQAECSKHLVIKHGWEANHGNTG